jgi:N-acetylneuraminic acid mutarotase
LHWKWNGHDVYQAGKSPLCPKIAAAALVARLTDICMKVTHMTAPRIVTLASWVVAALAAGGAAHAAPGGSSGLSLEERVACQRAVEQVYWRHRGGASGAPRRPFEQAVPEAVLRRKAEDAVRKSVALAQWWNTTITPTQLQAELDRIAAASQSPEVLAELFSALGQDPQRAAECIARPLLADRLIQSYFASDDRIHGAVRQQASAGLASLQHGGAAAGAERSSMRWVRGRDAVGGAGTALLSPEAFDQRVRFLRRSEGGRTGQPALGTFGPLREDARRVYALAIDALDGQQATLRSVSWPKTGFDRWWADHRGSLPTRLESTGATYRLPAVVPNANCRNDSWKPTLSGLDGRYEHAAVWTGSEMIVWGGMEAVGVYYNDGSRYDPATDTWTPVSLVGAPSARHAFSAAWTGQEMLVFGGTGDRTGGRYDPATDTWRATQTAGAPVGQQWSASVWTGKELIVWGGILGSPVDTGGRYNPKTDTWLPLPASPLAARSYVPAVWTGSEMVIWSGYDVTMGRLYRDGARFNPRTGIWTPMSTTGAPEAGYWHTAVWTGSEMITWGGISGNGRAHRYHPGTDTWATTTASGLPPARYLHNAVWTGSEMLVHGGWPSNGAGGRYNPSTDTWTLMPTLNAPTTGQASSMVWSGSEALLWGGLDEGFAFRGDGGRYSPATNQWHPMTTMNVPSARGQHSAEWTGAEMVVWGGYGYFLPETGGRFDPATHSWSTMSTLGQPAPRAGATSVWTGQEIIFWGAGPGDPFTPDSGGRYNPATDSWLPAARQNAPLVTYGHTAVWTGSEMITYGGISSSLVAKRYDPATDTWTNASKRGDPGHRDHHGAVWTGSEMIVWGGSIDSGELGPRGGRYHPATDTWVRIQNAPGQPAARAWPVSVWTGTEAIFWGGYDYLYTVKFNDGGRYNPATGGWTPTSLANAPTPRVAQGVWTGTEMLVWGGDNLPTGGRYDPAANRWTDTSTLRAPNAPSGGNWSTVWTGRQMLVWGGFGPTQTGGMYCVSDQPNLAPVAAGDSVVARSGKPLVVSAAASVLKNDSDANGDPLSARLISGPANGSLQVNANGSFSYQSTPGFSGPDSFRYVANDDLLDSPSATVKIKVK